MSINAGIDYRQLNKVPIELTVAIKGDKLLEISGQPQDFVPERRACLPAHTQPVGRNAVVPSGLTILGFSKAPFMFHSLPRSLNLAGSGETYRTFDFRVLAKIRRLSLRLCFLPPGGDRAHGQYSGGPS